MHAAADYQKNAVGTLSQASKKTFIHAAVAYIKKT
jgi:fructose-1,6-bisphosphatase/sedoheptulose 1,7-bisphosphatase-like protein